MATKYWCGISATWNTTASRWSLAPPGIVFSGSRSGTTLTVTTVYAGSITPGAVGTGPVLYNNAGTASGTIDLQLTSTEPGGTLGLRGTYRTTGAGGTITGPVDLYTILAGQTTTVPGSGDDVVFGSRSASSPTITGSSAVTVTSLTVSAPSSGNYTFTGTNSTATSSAFTLVAGTVWSNTGTMTFPGACTITTNGVSIASAVSIAGTGHLPSLAGNFNGTSTLSMTAGGTLTLNNYNWTCTTFSASGATAKTIAFGTSGTITTTASSTTVVSCTSSTAQISFTGTPVFVLSGSPSSGARTFSFTNASWGGSSQLLPGIRVPNGSDTVVITIPVTSIYSNLGAFDLSGLTGGVAFSNATTYLYVYGDFKLPNIILSGAPSSYFYLSGPTGSLLSLNHPSATRVLVFTNTYVQSGDLVYGTVLSQGPGRVTFNNTGTINITTYGPNINATFVGTLTATFGTFDVLGVAGSGTVTISTGTWAVNGQSTLPSTATVTVSADNGDIVSIQNTQNPYTINVTGSGTGGVRNINGYVSTYQAYQTNTGPKLNITTGAGDVAFIFTGNPDINNTDLQIHTLDTTGFTGTSITGFVCVYSALTIPQTLTLPSFYVNAYYSTLTLAAANAKYYLLVYFYAAVNLSGINNFSTLSNTGGTLNFGSSTVNADNVTINNYGESNVNYSTTSFGSSTINVTTQLTIYLAQSSFTAGTSTVNLLSTARVDAYDNSLNNVVIASTGSHLFANGCRYIASLTNSVVPATVLFNGGFRFGNFGLNGTSGNPVTVSGAFSTNAKLAKSTDWVVGANSVDAGNNVGNISYTGSSPNWLILSYLTVGYEGLFDVSTTIGGVTAEGGANVWNEYFVATSSVAEDVAAPNATFRRAVTNSSTITASTDASGGFIPLSFEGFAYAFDEPDAAQGYDSPFAEEVYAVDEAVASGSISIDISDEAFAVDETSGANIISNDAEDAASVASTPGFLSPTFDGFVVNAVSTSDAFAVAPSIFNVALLAYAQVLDEVVGGGLFNGEFVAAASAYALVDGFDLWNPIDDSQTANWGPVNNTQTASWSATDDSQTANWQNVNTVVGLLTTELSVPLSTESGVDLGVDDPATPIWTLINNAQLPTWTPINS